MTKITAEKRREVADLIESGEKFTSICQKCKISRPTLNKIRKTLQESENEAGSETETLKSETVVFGGTGNVLSTGKLAPFQTTAAKCEPAKKFLVI